MNQRWSALFIPIRRELRQRRPISQMGRPPPIRHGQRHVQLHVSQMGRRPPILHVSHRRHVLQIPILHVSQIPILHVSHRRHVLQIPILHVSQMGGGLVGARRLFGLGWPIRRPGSCLLSARKQSTVGLGGSIVDEIRCEIELREDEDRAGPGRIYGTVIKYGVEARDRREVFELNSLKWDGPLILNRQHSRKNPIQRVTPIVVGDEVRIDEPLIDSSAGRDCAVEIRSGLLTGLSIEFRSIQESVVNGVRRIASASLGAIGLVDSPAYAASGVEVRAKPRHKRRQIWL